MTSQFLPAAIRETFENFDWLRNFEGSNLMYHMNVNVADMAFHLKVKIASDSEPEIGFDAGLTECFHLFYLEHSMHERRRAKPQPSRNVPYERPLSYISSSLSNYKETIFPKAYHLYSTASKARVCVSEYIDAIPLGITLTLNT